MIHSRLAAFLPLALMSLATFASGEEVTPPASGVTASTSDTNVAGNVVDNNLGTRWSGSGDGAWIQLDLGTTRLVESVSIAAYQGNARRNQFDLQVSTGGGIWTTVLPGAQTGGTSTLEQSFDIADQDARYVRYVGHGATVNAGGTSTWNSVTEISVFAAAIGATPTPTPVAATPTPTSTPTAPPSATPTPTPTVPASGEITPGASGVSATTNDGNIPGNAVDNNLGTRWSANGDPQSITFNLGALHTVTHVRIAFYNGNQRQSRFDLQVSSNGTTWTNVLTNQLSNGTSTAEQMFDFADTQAQYVRYLGHGNTVNLWNSLTEVSIFGSVCASCPTPTPPAVTPTPTPTPVTATPTPTSTPSGGTRPVDINGQLHVCGTKLCNQYGNPIQLRGMSTHGLQWYAQCYDPGTAWIDALVNDWKADVLRVSMYVQEGGYETNPTMFTALADRIIDKAIARGIYVVIDWHMLTPGDPNSNLSRAQTYFTHMATRYGNTPNVLYEIANEPNGSTVTWSRIKTYANAIIPTIRNIDPDGVVLCGTRDWSSLGLSGSTGPSEVINSPLTQSNVMYVFHMYAASHDSTYLNGLSSAANSIPMFVTEWGTQQASGDGGNNFTMSQQYVDMMRTKQISWINWNYSDDERSGAVFTVGTCPNGPFTGAGGRLKPAGTWIRERIISPADNFPTN